MTRSLLTAITLLFLALPAAAQVQEVTIAQINTVTAENLAAGVLTSPLVGDTVTFVGVALSATVADRASNDFRPILTAGRRYVNYIQDTNGVAFGGIVVLADNDTIARETLFDRIDSGDVVRITGVVQQFPNTPNGANQISILRSSEVEILYHTERPEPVPVTIGDFYRRDGASQTPQYTTGAQYTGRLVELTNVTVKSSSVTQSGSAAGRVTIIVVDEQGNEIRVRDQSGYFLARQAAARLEYFGQEALDHIEFVDTTDFWQLGYGTFMPPTPGTVITRLVGTISANTSSGQTVPFMFTPMYPDDLEVGEVAAVLPTISTVRRSIGFPREGQNVPVTFVVQPGDNPIEDANVRIGFKVGLGPGNPFGGTQYVTATRTSDSTFSAEIPAQSPADWIVYWIEAPDTQGGRAIAPADTATFKYFYRTFGANGRVRIRNVQATPNLFGTSGYVGFEVPLTGVVVADTSDFRGDRGNDPHVVIEQMEANGALLTWSGIPVRATGADGAINAEIAGLQRGDSVTITGTIRERTDVTTLTDVTIVEKHGTGMIPPPLVISTDVINQKRDGRSADAEPYEGMLIAYDNVVVTSANADAPSNFGEFLVAEIEMQGNPAAATRVETEDSFTGYTTGTPDAGETAITAGMQFERIAGILYHRNNNYKLIPRDEADMVAMGNGVRTVAVLAGVSAAIAPNPASGHATMVIATDRPTIIAIEILSPLGASVRTVLKRASVDGTARVAIDLDGLAAGTYFVRMSTPDGALVRPIVVVR